MLFWQIPIWFNRRRFKNILPGRFALLAVWISTICAVYYTVLYLTVLYCTLLYCTALYCGTALYCTVLYCNVLYCAALYCTVLYCTVLYCTVLYLTVLHCTLSVLSWTELYEKESNCEEQKYVSNHKKWKTKFWIQKTKKKKTKPEKHKCLERRTKFFKKYHIQF